MGEIPEDIRKRAVDLADSVIRVTEGCACLDCQQQATDIISEAIIAERERCARIAESFGMPSRYGQIHGETALDADIIAAAIRKGD